jgi:HEAT repeat protein
MWAVAFFAGESDGADDESPGQARQRALADPNAPFMARTEAAYALANIGGAEAWAALERAAEHDASERVRHAAARPLQKLTTRPD